MVENRSRETKIEARRPLRGDCYRPGVVGGFKLGGGDRHNLMRNIGLRIYFDVLLIE